MERRNNILIVEPDPALRALIGLVLNDIGSDVTAYEGVEQAQDTLSRYNNQYDAVIMGATSNPEYFGRMISLLGRAREYNPELSAIMFASSSRIIGMYNDELQRLNALVLPIPFSLDDFINMIQENTPPYGVGDSGVR